jgi:type II secretory pathway component PulC
MNVKIKSVILILVLLLSATVFFKRGFAGLIKGRQNEIDKMVMQEKSKKSYLPVVFHSITREPMPKTLGLVKGILYSENKSSIVISDKNSIVYEENSIYGATIVKIHKDKVEFAKNGQRWTQKVGETPSPEWYR